MTVFSGHDNVLHYSTSFSMLHLLHPFALSQLHVVLGHVRRFQTLLNSLFPQTENALLAKQLLTDAIRTSGVDLDALDKILNAVQDDVRAFAGKSLLH